MSEFEIGLELNDLPNFEEDVSELEAGEKLLLSPTSIISYMNDPARYYFRKIRKLREPGSEAATEGSTYHNGIEFALTHKFNTGVLPPLTDTFQFIEAFWEERVKQFDPASAPDPRRLQYVKDFFAQQLYERLNTVDPKYLEHYVRLELPDRPFNLHGYLDLVDSTNRHAFPTFDPRTDTLTDFKSRKSSPPKDSSGKYTMTNFDRLQLTLYAFMLSQAKYSVKARIIYLVKTKSPTIREAVTMITPEEQLARLRTVEKIALAIEHQVFTPNYGSWLCAENKCYFWDMCHKTF